MTPASIVKLLRYVYKKKGSRLNQHSRLTETHLQKECNDKEIGKFDSTNFITNL